MDPESGRSFWSIFRPNFGRKGVHFWERRRSQDQNRYVEEPPKPFRNAGLLAKAVTLEFRYSRFGMSTFCFILSYILFCYLDCCVFCIAVVVFFIFYFVLHCCNNR